MFNIFVHPPTLDKHSYMLRDYKETLLAIQQLYTYYSKAGFRVHNDHILVRLIKFLFSSYSDDDQYMRAIQAQLSMVGTLGLGTEYRSGRLLDDPFVGGLHKCLIYIEDTSTANTFPVTVVQHPFTHTSLPLLNGKMLEKDMKDDALESHVSTYSISVRSLMLRFKHYMSDATVDPNIRSVAHFVHSRVLSTMFLSFYQLALWNRMWYPLIDLPIVDAVNRHPVKILNLKNASISRHNTVKELRSIGLVSYSEILAWQFRRGYALSTLGKLPAGVHIYRPTAAFAWFSRVDMIRALLLLGQHSLYTRQRDVIRELEYQYQLTTNGRFIADPSLRTRITSHLESMLDSLSFVK